jgi:sodium/bile acid cotransporter 7
MDPSVTVPRSEAAIARVAAALALPIPAACMPGVVANLALLARHAETLLAAPAPGRA